MYLIRRDPFFSLPTFQSLQREMNRMFDEVFGNVDPGSTRAWAPPLEIYETGEELVVVAELPGFRQKEINISFDNGQLVLSGERKMEDEDRNYHRNERWYGNFERSFHLPTAYDPNKITAKLHNGILTVRLPKKLEAKARQIPVSSS